MHHVQICTACKIDLPWCLVTEPATAAPGRRELNKARTREAIIAALRGLAEQQALETITVDQVAEQADVSRRTFFNYFGSIPALLSEVFAEQATEIVAGLDRAQLAADPVGAVRSLVADGGIPHELLGWLAVVNAHDPSPELVPIERAVWSDLAAWLTDVVTELLPDDTDPLYVSTLATAVMSTFAAAEQSWLGEITSRTALSPEDVAAFHEHLDRALSYLAVSWRTTP